MLKIALFGLVILKYVVILCTRQKYSIYLWPHNCKFLKSKTRTRIVSGCKIIRFFWHIYASINDHFVNICNKIHILLDTGHKIMTFSIDLSSN